MHREHTRGKIVKISSQNHSRGAQTHDHKVKSRALCQLSWAGLAACVNGRAKILEGSAADKGCGTQDWVWVWGGVSGETKALIVGLEPAATRLPASHSAD